MISMTKLVATAVLAALPGFAMAHGDQGPWQGHGPGMMMDQEQMQQMHQNWSRMNQLMQRMPNEASPEERQRLMREHWESMQGQMELMHDGMMGPGMMQGRHGMMNGQHMMNDRESNKGNGPSTDQKLQMMQERMDQMQLMMEQMLQHQRNLNEK
jgi:hypothetical protein